MGRQSNPQTFHEFDALNECAIPASHRPERLVGLGFRRALKAIETGDQVPWEFAWQDFANATDPGRATQLVARLSGWARAVRRCSGRPINTLPPSCPGFCRDECLAISMIAASQHNICPALRACAFALMGGAEFTPALEAAGSFGDTLTRSGHILSPQSVCNALTFSEPANRKPS